MPSEIKKHIPTALFATTGIGLLYMLFRHKSFLIKQLKTTYNFSNPLRHQTIKIIETPEECRQIVNHLLS